MAIIGAHMLLYSSEPEALRSMLSDAFGFKSVDAHGGWLIFTLPPAEVAVHPQDSQVRHQMSLMCDDIVATMAELRARGVQFDGEPQSQRWGTVVTMSLPGDVKMMLYQPRHALAIESR
jgi:hypothetical protein